MPFGRKRNDEPPPVAPPSGGSTGSGRPSALGMALFDRPPVLDATTFRAAHAALWPSDPLGDLGTETPFVWESPAGRLAVMDIDQPIPNGEAEDAVRWSWLWKDPLADLARVQAHCITWCAGDDAVAAHRAAGRLLATLMTLPGALGVYVGSAWQVVHAGVFVDLLRMAEEDGSLASMVWIGTPASHDGGRSTVLTAGLEGFGLPELELVDSARPIGELRERAWEIAGYLIANGPVFRDGDTMGATAEERILIRHSASVLDRPGTVYRIEGL